MSFQDDLSRDEFYQAAIQPDFPDCMQFVLTAAAQPSGEGDLTFSEEGIENLTDQIKHFIMARILGTWRKQNLAPKELSVGLVLDFKAPDEEMLRKGAWPWWALVDKGAHPLDGGHRGTP